MKKFEEFINEELGESNVSPYSYDMTKYEDGDLVIQYKFITEDGDKYVVRFFDMYRIHKQDKYKDYYQLEFVTSDSEYDAGDTIVINKGRFYKVISTVISIIKDFVKFKDPRVLKISPSKNFRKDKRRKNIYIRYIERLLPEDYKYKKSFFGDSLYITKK